MSNNARAVIDPDGEWGEIGISQYVQAQSAEVPPTTDMNPVLLKPRGDGESQLVIQGEAVEHVPAGSYYDSYWDEARRAAVESYERLAEQHDIIVAEGAGSIAEINLQHRDLANIETARFADAAVLLVVNIERGGAFASLFGTLELMPADVRGRVCGAVITKFRGDPALLESGIEEIEARTEVPILGVIPHDDPGLPEEDSVSLPSTSKRVVTGDDDGVPEGQSVTVGVPRLPRISNFTDFEPLANEPGVRVTYLPLDSILGDVDAVVLPGTKNTVDDLLALRGAGFEDQLNDFSGPIVGICGGYQMLGERITNAGVESTSERDVVDGFGLLPVETQFATTKRVEQVTVPIDGVGMLAGAEGTASGYEIHMGRSTPTMTVDQPLGSESAATERVLGTYLHGVFENENVRMAFLDTVFEYAGQGDQSERQTARSPHDRAADLLKENMSGHDLPVDL